jgi:NTP pyrophosphatase (non-canonical NTP hydrolase)
MKLNEYMEKAGKTAIFTKEKGLVYCTLGLTGEAGEFADKVKKIIRDDNNELSEEKRQALAGELGDVMWYTAMLARELGTTLEEVAQNNLDKLESRRLRGKLKGSGDDR